MFKIILVVLYRNQFHIQVRPFKKISRPNLIVFKNQKNIHVKLNNRHALIRYKYVQ